MSNTNDRNLINLKEAGLDVSIYRIYSKDRYLGMLASNEDAVVNPTKWEDPFENFFLEKTKVRDPNGLISLQNLARDWYGQCWSLNKETDAMWRIYSPNPAMSSGVKVQTTIRKLFDNFKAAGSAAPYLNFFIGQVEYIEEPKLRQFMGTLTFSGVMSGQAEGFAQLLCIKRTEFEHEAEIRLIFHDYDSQKGNRDVFKFPLDPNALFDEVVLDPRLTDADETAVKAELQIAGCTLPIYRSLLYQSPNFIIPP